MTPDPHETVRSALHAVDAFACPGGDGYVWPLNEAALLVDVSPDGGFLRVRVREGSFPDGADLCRVNGKDAAACGAACGACSLRRDREEDDESFARRLARFLDRVCERSVAYEDRFVGTFRT